MRHPFRRPAATLASLLTLCLSPAALAAQDDHQDGKSITESVRTYLEHRLASTPGRHEIRVARLDPHLRLPRCTAPLEVTLPSSRPPLGRLNLVVSCQGTSQTKPWRIYVGARVAHYRRIVVARTFLPRGRAIGDGDLVDEERDVSTLPRGYFLPTADLHGMVAKRPIRAGQALTPDMVRPPLLVRRGEAVTIVAEHGGLSVRMAGKALVDGALGATVRVRNDRSKRIVEGRVSGERRVSVNL